MKIAIIGASTGQLPLCLKAKEMGLETICFAWEDGAVCKEYVDKFYPISITEKERITQICRQEQVDGVVSNASDTLSDVVAYVAQQLHLVGNDYNALLRIKDKYCVRLSSAEVVGLKQIPFSLYGGNLPAFFPCIVKPCTGAAKKGVSYVETSEDFIQAIQYATSVGETKILIEKFVSGREVSVESISFQGQHWVLQITDKENSGPPHFVELGHHQPSSISHSVREKIEKIVPRLLDSVHFENGASHIELKIDHQDDIYLIEINPRGGGDEISSQLVYLSTGYDYIKGMLEVALGTFIAPRITSQHYAGIYYLCSQSQELLPAFIENVKHPWLVEKSIIASSQLSQATGNYDRNGHYIYQWNSPRPLNYLKRLTLNE